jgi:hypothetical protein
MAVAVNEAPPAAEVKGAATAVLLPEPYGVGMPGVEVRSLNRRLK